MKIIRDEMYECCRWCKNYNIDSNSCSRMNPETNIHDTIQYVFEEGHIYSAIQDILSDGKYLKKDIELSEEIDLYTELDNAVLRTLIARIDDSITVSIDENFCCIYFNE